MIATVSTAQAIGAREEQEDRFLSLPDRNLYATADGIGGHSDGAEAAQAAVDALAAATRCPPSLEALSAAFDRAHEAVVMVGPACYVTRKVGEHKMSCGCRKLPGSTLSALWIDGERAMIGHIGDTRIWRVREGKAEQLTEDHNIHGRILLRSLGGKSKDTPDLLDTDAKPGDVFILCSDGVLLDGEQIAAVLESGSFDSAALRLVEAGAAEYEKRSPNVDNATCLAIRIGEGR
jgi:serine/threonine protein phosphatase PrpC